MRKMAHIDRIRLVQAALLNIGRVAFENLAQHSSKLEDRPEQIVLPAQRHPTSFHSDIQFGESGAEECKQQQRLR